MNLKATFEKKVFIFKRPSGTSRGILNEKKSWFITVWDTENPEIQGIGECSVIPNLTPDYRDDLSYEAKIREICESVQFYAENPDELNVFPSIFFGLETALLDLKNGGKRIFFNTAFTQKKQAIPINGLIWMGDEEFMQQQVEDKIKEGFTCIKMKIGAIDFETEFQILQSIRNRFSVQQITLRVDANGAFSPDDAPAKLEQLKSLEIHSIEQPIRQGQREEMKKICAAQLVPVALDEELIGISKKSEKEQLLLEIQPQFIILKPGLIGGFKGAKEWIEIAEKNQMGWWMTSALESNIGLDAIAQFTSTFPVVLPQGLGTGSLYTHNISSDLVVERGFLKKK